MKIQCTSALMKVHCFLFRYFKGVSRGPRKCLHFWGGYPIYIGLRGDFAKSPLSTF